MENEIHVKKKEKTMLKQKKEVLSCYSQPLLIVVTCGGWRCSKTLCENVAHKTGASRFSHRPRLRQMLQKDNGFVIHHEIRFKNYTNQCFHHKEHECPSSCTKGGCAVFFFFFLDWVFTKCVPPWLCSTAGTTKQTHESHSKGTWTPVTDATARQWTSKDSALARHAIWLAEAPEPQVSCRRWWSSLGRRPLCALMTAPPTVPQSSHENAWDKSVARLSGWQRSKRGNARTRSESRRIGWRTLSS